MLEELSLGKFQKYTLPTSQLAKVYGGSVATELRGNTDTWSVVCTGNDYDYTEVYIIDGLKTTRTFTLDHLINGYGGV